MMELEKGHDKKSGEPSHLHTKCITIFIHEQNKLPQREIGFPTIFHAASFFIIICWNSLGTERDNLIGVVLTWKNNKIRHLVHTKVKKITMETFQKMYVLSCYLQLLWLILFITEPLKMMINILLCQKSTLLFFSLAREPVMAFRCGQNIQISKCYSQSQKIVEMYNYNK